MNGLDLSSQNGIYSLISTLLIVGFVAFRMLGERRFKLRSWWIMPAVLVLLTATSLWADVRGSLTAGLLTLLGAGLGWLVGELNLRTFQVRLDPTDPALVRVKGSPLTVIVILGSFALRLVMQLLIGQHVLHGALNSLSGTLLAFGMTLLIMRNYGVYRTAMRLRAGRKAHA